MDINGFSRSTSAQRDRASRRVLALSATAGVVAATGAGALAIALAPPSVSSVTATSVTPATTTTVTTKAATTSSSTASSSSAPVATSGGS